MTSPSPAAASAATTATAPRAIEIVVNGRSCSVPADTTVARLLEALSLAGRHVAVERNLQVVPRALQPETLLAAGDVLEVVSLVGGG
jgi:sulfur carrier protein